MELSRIGLANECPPHVRSQRDYAISETGSRPSPDIESAGILISDFQPLDCEEEMSVVYKAPTSWYFCYESPNGLRHKVGVSNAKNNKI